MNKLLFSTDISFEEHFCDYECAIVADIVSFATIYGTNIYLDLLTPAVWIWQPYGCVCFSFVCIHFFLMEIAMI